MAAAGFRTARTQVQTELFGRFRVDWVPHADRVQSKGDPKMNWDRIEGNWKQFAGNVREQWGKLTNDDLDMIKGERQKLAGRIQERYGIAKDEAERQIDDWLTRH